MPKSDRVIADAEALLQRVSPEGRRLAQRVRQRRTAAAAKTGKRIAVATAAVIAMAVIWALVIGPIGVLGFTGALGAIILAAAIILLSGQMPEETPERLGQAEIAQLPGRTESWLQSQRPALPAPAARLVDGIGLRLEAIAPQVATLDPAEPAAAALRKLIAEELPDLIQSYTRVPPSLRKQARDGASPDAQLIEGLGLVDSTLSRMSADLASGDLQKFAIQGRYLELKYKGDEEA